jgi:hypothetical protein
MSSGTLRSSDASETDPRFALRIIPRVRGPGASPPQWHVCVLARSLAPAVRTLTPRVRLDNAKVVGLQPASARVRGSEWTAFFLHVTGTQDSREGSVTVELKEAPGYAESSPLPLTSSPPIQPFGDVETQLEAERPAPGPIGSRLPLRPMEVRDGVLRYPDGREVALWGVAYYPQSFTQYFSLERLGVDRRRSTDEDLDDFIEMGLDIIRIHVFDSEISDGDGDLLENDHLDGLDYLVAQCNRKGIYLMLTPIAWWGSPGARPDSFSRNTPMPAMSMWPAMWPIQVRYIRQLLTHKNPYTGHRLVDEPSLALFEIINEPWYWSYSEVVSGDIAPEGAEVTETTKRGWAGVRDAFEKAVPAQWRDPATFAWFRYDTVRVYIDTMVEAIRSIGAQQPIAYLMSNNVNVTDSDVVQAVADSRCDAVTLSTYAGGLHGVQDDRNLLGELADRWPLDPRLEGKARLVYEFDAPGMLRQANMYPAMAMHFRRLGVQVASQFQYDPRATAHVNWDWPIFYLNLWHTPEKIVSFLIGGEVFRRLPRGSSFDLPQDNQVFAPAAVSFERNMSLLAADDSYMQTGPTDWRPLPIPESPGHITSVGSCPYFDYEGTGVVDLKVEGNAATLRIWPDVERLPRGRAMIDDAAEERSWLFGGLAEMAGTLEQPLTALHERGHTFCLRLPGWAQARVERLEGDTRIPIKVQGGSLTVRPGTYRLIR